MATLAEVVRELERLKHQRAVWMQTVEHLAIFIDQEVQPAQKGILAEGCVVTPVPQPIVQEFIDRINDEEIDPLNEQIEALEALSVQEIQDDGPEGKAKPKRAASKKANAGAKGGKAGRKIRSIKKPTGPKAQGVG